MLKKKRRDLVHLMRRAGGRGWSKDPSKMRRMWWSEFEQNVQREGEENWDPAGASGPTPEKRAFSCETRRKETKWVKVEVVWGSRASFGRVPFWASTFSVQWRPSQPPMVKRNIFAYRVWRDRRKCEWASKRNRGEHCEGNTIFPCRAEHLTQVKNHEFLVARPANFCNCAQQHLEKVDNQTDPSGVEGVRLCGW